MLSTVSLFPFVMLYVIIGYILYINLLSQEELCIYVERFTDRRQAGRAGRGVSNVLNVPVSDYLLVIAHCSLSTHITHRQLANTESRV